jgi:hypothetical protein
MQRLDSGENSRAQLCRDVHAIRPSVRGCCPQRSGKAGWAQYRAQRRTERAEGSANKAATMMKLREKNGRGEWI